MYEEFYGLESSPFRLTPDRRFFFGSEGHRKAMSYLKYGLYQGEGFIVITGDVGTGKSTLVSQLFAELDTDEIVAAQIGTTQIEADDAIRLIVAAFNITPPSQDKAALLSAFESFLMDQHHANRRVLLVVDEAQNLPMRTLEELRMLSNFNVGGMPLFQCFLVGQPQFLRLLSHPDLAQLQQRVIASYRLEPITLEETQAYVEHRLSTVGWSGDPAFSDDAFEAIFTETKGVPRKINTLANRILLYGALEELHEIDGPAVENVLRDLRKEVAESQLVRPGDSYGAHNPMPQPGPAAGSAPAHAFQGQGNGARAPLGNGAGPSRAEAQILARLERIEHTLEEHDRAISELIDTAVNWLHGVPVPSDDDDAPSPAAQA